MYDLFLIVLFAAPHCLAVSLLLFDRPKNLYCLFKLPAKFCTWLFIKVAVKSIKWSIVLYYIPGILIRKWKSTEIEYQADVDMWFEKMHYNSPKDIFVPCDKRGIPKIDIVFGPSHKDAFIPNSACRICGFPLSRDKSNFKVCTFCESSGLKVVKASPEEIAEKHNQNAIEEWIADNFSYVPMERLDEFLRSSYFQKAFEKAKSIPPPRPVKRPSKLHY